MNNGEKPLPYSEDDEKGVLCSLILSPLETMDLCERLNLKPEYFYAPAHRIVYETAVEWRGDGAVELAWLKREIKKRDQLKEIGGPEFLDSLRSFVPTGSNVDYYIEGVLDKWRRRNTILECRRRENAAFDEHEPVESFDPEGVFGPAKNGALPPFESLVDLSAVELPEPEVLIAGLLHVGSKLSIGGASKSYKTWSLIEMGLSVATGRPWLGHDTKPGRVLYINLELQKAFFRKRIEAVAAAKGLPINGTWQQNFVVWNLRGFCVNSDSLCKEILRRTRKADPFALIIIDPLYKILGNREENSNDQIAALLNLLERVARETSAAIAYGQHFSKGNQADKEPLDRASGAGVFARDPDSIVTLTRHKTDGAYTVEAMLRNFAPIEPFVVRWDYPRFIRDEALDPAELKRPKRGGRSPLYSVEDLIECLGSQDLSTVEFQKLVHEQKGMSAGKFYELLKEGKSLGSLHQCQIDGKWEVLSKAQN